MNIKDIKNPDFIKKLDEKELNELAKDIREFLIESISKTGGHLSSNLGVVELTIALHYCFDSPNDKFLFDVGHQSYVHKILTGRAKDFDKLRKYNGLSGFQSRKESKYDPLDAGHSSTTLSIGLGMAVARDLNHENYHIVPIVGDASIAAGLSLEALNQIGDLKSKMIIVFNDNNMSISKNVGILKKVFASLRSSKSYINLKENVKDNLIKKKKGKSYISFIRNIKDSIKTKIIKDGIFGEFSIDYLGPIDGHDIKSLINAFNAAKEKDGPVVIHVVTKKGKGYKYAEEDSSGKWHGISPFDIKTGETLKKLAADKINYSKLVADHLHKLMKKDKNIIAITPAMISGSCLEVIFKDYPDRSFDCGIAEDHSLDFAAGLALANKKPFVSIYSSFLQRAYDQVNHDIGRMNLPVVLGIDRAGIVGEDGPSHQGVYDIGLLRPIPNVIIAQGKDANEIRNLLELGFKTGSPFAIRYPRGSLINEKYKKLDINVGKWEKIINNDNEGTIIITYGEDVLKIKERIEKEDLNYNLVNARFIKPIDERMLLNLAAKNKKIIIYTTDMIKGGLGDSILEFYSKKNLSVPVTIFGIDEIYVKHGESELVKKELKLDLDYLFKYLKKNA